MFHYYALFPYWQQMSVCIFITIIGHYLGFLSAWPSLMVLQKEIRFFFQAEGRVGSVSIKQKLHENDALIIRDYLATVKMIKFSISTRVMGLV